MAAVEWIKVSNIAHCIAIFLEKSKYPSTKETGKYENTTDIVSQEHQLRGGLNTSDSVWMYREIQIFCYWIQLNISVRDGNV